MNQRVNRAVFIDVEIVMDTVLILPKELGVLIQLDEAITRRRVVLRLINGEQVAVRKQMAAKPVDLVVAERIPDVGRAGPGPAEGQFPLVDRVAAHIEQSGLRAMRSRDQREAVASL